MNSIPISPVLDSKTSLTRNDICRLLKGFLREQVLGGAMYCINILQKAECFADTRRLVVAGFFETGTALNFASILPALAAVREGDFAGLRDIVRQLCSRNKNYYAMVPDMIARIAGLNEEVALVQEENICYPRILLLIKDIRLSFISPDKNQEGFFIQTTFALIFNLQNNMVHDYWCIWRVVRLQRLLVLAGFAETLWKLYLLLPTYYQHWDNEETRSFLTSIASLRQVFLHSSARPRMWDKQRLLHATIAIGLLFGFDVNAKLSVAAQNTAQIVPIPLPPFFYSTAPVPPASAAIVKRASRPTSAGHYIALRCGNTDPVWDGLRADLIQLLTTRGMYGVSDPEVPELAERPRCSMTMQSLQFRRRIPLARVFIPSGQRGICPALCPHVFFLEPAVNRSAICSFNNSLVKVWMAAPHLAVMHPTTMLQPTSEFMIFYKHPLEERKGPVVLVGGPFCDGEAIAHVIAYRAFWRAIGLSNEPFLMLQRDLTVVSIFCQSEWAAALIDREERVFVWVLEWILRFVLSLDPSYRSCDFVQDAAGNMLCLAAYYPSYVSPADVFPPSTEYVEQMLTYGATQEIVEGVLHFVEETLRAPNVDALNDLPLKAEKTAFERAMDMGCPPSLCFVHKSVVLQSTIHFSAQLATLRKDLQIKWSEIK